MVRRKPPGDLDLVRRCGFCSRPLPPGFPEQSLRVGSQAGLQFCSRNCLESYLEISLDREGPMPARR